MMDFSPQSAICSGCSHHWPVELIIKIDELDAFLFTGRSKDQTSITDPRKSPIGFEIYGFMTQYQHFLGFCRWLVGCKLMWGWQSSARAGGEGRHAVGKTVGSMKKWWNQPRIVSPCFTVVLSMWLDELVSLFTTGQMPPSRWKSKWVPWISLRLETWSVQWTAAEVSTRFFPCIPSDVCPPFSKWCLSTFVQFLCVCVFHVFHCTYPFFLSCRGCQQHQLPSGTFLVWSVEPVRPGYVCIYIYILEAFFLGGWLLILTSKKVWNHYRIIILLCNMLQSGLYSADLHYNSSIVIFSAVLLLASRDGSKFHLSRVARVDGLHDRPPENHQSTGNTCFALDDFWQFFIATSLSRAK